MEKGIFYLLLCAGVRFLPGYRENEFTLSFGLNSDIPSRRKEFHTKPDESFRLRALNCQIGNIGNSTLPTNGEFQQPRQPGDRVLQ